MINAEKLFEMMNPNKAFEVARQGKVFDLAAQSEMFEKFADQIAGLAGLYQEQTRKTLDFWMDQNETAVKEGQKFAKDWVATLAKTNSEIAGEMNTTIQKVAEVFEPTKPARTTKKA